MVPCSKFQFVHNSNLSFKKELNIFLLDLQSKYVLCFFSLKKFKISKLLVGWIFVALFIISFEQVALQKSKNDFIDHFISSFFMPLNFKLADQSNVYFDLFLVLHVNSVLSILA